jgi:hypothetical protein
MSTNAGGHLSFNTLAKLKTRASDVAAVARADALLNEDSDEYDDEFDANDNGGQDAKSFPPKSHLVEDTGQTFSPQRQEATKALVSMKVNLLNGLGMDKVARLKVRASDLAAVARADAILNHEEEEEGEDEEKKEPRKDNGARALHDLGMGTVAKLKVRASDLAAVARADAILHQIEEEEEEESPAVVKKEPPPPAPMPPSQGLGLGIVAKLKVRAADLAILARADCILNHEDEDEDEDEEDEDEKNPTRLARPQLPKALDHHPHIPLGLSTLARIRVRASDLASVARAGKN